MATYIPKKLHRMLKEFIPIFRGLAEAVIDDPADMAMFDLAANEALDILQRQADARTCPALEDRFAQMAVLFVEAPLLKSKPRNQVQMVIDEIERLGAALGLLNCSTSRH
ncbi:hypothetical protein P3T43_004335 [Paraburkholderia sp. GAS41]|jgi:hypothetical protein|uniref:hypothetical protein n=1 Tax=Paraburkholderia sp. GAS41 TaxID=3035134 RepID=UPI003D196B89